MNANNLTIATIALAVLTSACSSMSKNECLVADWQKRGMLDGSIGAPMSLLARHDEACAKVSIEPDRTLYLQGYKQGLLTYCTPENAFAEGRDNVEYAGVCPTPQEAGFLASYIDGLELKLIDLEQQGHAIDSQLFRLRLVSSVPGNKTGSRLKERIAQRERALNRITSERFDLRIRIANYRQQLDLLR